MNLDSKIPEGPLEQKWDSFKSNMKLINPSNKRKYKVLVVGVVARLVVAIAQHNTPFLRATGSDCTQPVRA